MMVYGSLNIMSKLYLKLVISPGNVICYLRHHILFGLVWLQRLEKCLKELNIPNAVWVLGKAGQFYQVKVNINVQSQRVLSLFFAKMAVAYLEVLNTRRSIDWNNFFEDFTGMPQGGYSAQFWFWKKSGIPRPLAARADLFESRPPPPPQKVKSGIILLGGANTDWLLRWGGGVFLLNSEHKTYQKCILCSRLEALWTTFKIGAIKMCLRSFQSCFVL